MRDYVRYILCSCEKVEPTDRPTKYIFIEQITKAHSQWFENLSLTNEHRKEKEKQKCWSSKYAERQKNIFFLLLLLLLDILQFRKSIVRVFYILLVYIKFVFIFIFTEYGLASTTWRFELSFQEEKKKKKRCVPNRYTYYLRFVCVCGA